MLVKFKWVKTLVQLHGLHGQPSLKIPSSCGCSYTIIPMEYEHPQRVGVEI